MQFPLRIDFTDDETASRLFHAFPPDEWDWIEGCARKRWGAAQVVLLRVTCEGDYERFVALCLQHPAVTSVSTITEAESWAAPSNAV